VCVCVCVCVCEKRFKKSILNCLTCKRVDPFSNQYKKLRYYLCFCRNQFWYNQFSKRSKERNNIQKIYMHVHHSRYRWIELREMKCMYSYDLKRAHSRHIEFLRNNMQIGNSRLTSIFLHLRFGIFRNKSNKNNKS